ncbi:MAG: hypothetical protein PHE43_00945 [Candidatus Nanoarchaeia archaeon]|nr:hypothetical protein [Candidatus Nanoarchaeia archaeon]
MDNSNLKSLEKSCYEEFCKFIDQNRNKILAEFKRDISYSSGGEEIPSIPIVDGYLRDLEIKLQEEVRKLGFFNGHSHRIIQDYWAKFYYNVLPDLIHPPLKSNKYKKAVNY